MNKLATMFSFLAVIAAAPSCTLQRETMVKGHPTKGTGYSYTVVQIGGQFAGESSSGTKAVVNNETSFKDFMQTMGVAFAGWTAASVSKAKEVSAQLASKEITKQQAAASLEKIKLAEIEAGVTTATTLNPNVIPK